MKISVKSKIAISVLIMEGLIYVNEATGESDHIITVATYNIWNVMFHWEVRKYYIAKMIRRQDPDVIAFQEVRAHRSLKRNQVKDLQNLLPQYKQLVYHPVNFVKIFEEVHPPGWEWEGLGILSKHSILSSQIVNLTFGSGADKNRRAILSVQIEISGKELSLVNVHFSYDKSQQCRNADDILSYLYSTGTENSIILGDFNAVDDYSWPVSAVMNGRFSLNAPRACIGKHFKQRDRQGFGEGYLDSWMQLHPGKTGFTFSNMPSPGMQSRPDRILVSKTGLRLLLTQLDGDGNEYGRQYKQALFWYRLYTVYKLAQFRAIGKSFDYTCDWNCGPHGSCRCGICVRGDDQHTCASQDCFECDPGKFIMAQITTLCLVPCFLYLIIFTIGSIWYSTVRSSANYTSLKRSRHFVFRNKYLAVAAILALILLGRVLQEFLQDALNIVNAQLVEELFPSDHLMVVTKIKFTY